MFAYNAIHLRELRLLNFLATNISNDKTTFSITFYFFFLTKNCCCIAVSVLRIYYSTLLCCRTAKVLVVYFFYFFSLGSELTLFVVVVIKIVFLSIYRKLTFTPTLDSSSPILYSLVGVLVFLSFQKFRTRLHISLYIYIYIWYAH